MQHSPFLPFSVLVFIFQAVVALTVHYFLSKWLPAYRLRYVRVAFWLITSFAYSVIFFWRFIAMLDYGSGLILFFLKLSYVWSVGLIGIVLGFTLIYLAGVPNFLVKYGRKIKTQSKTVRSGEGDSLDADRRIFLKSAVAALPFLSFGFSAKGVVDADSKITVHRGTIPISGLSKTLDGFKIAQITDTHVGTYFNIEKLRQAIDIVQEEKPHLLVITGDFIDDITLLAPTFELINSLAEKMPCGAYFCWGNHEYFRDFRLIEKYLKQSPITVLKNENKLVYKADIPLYLLGVDYPFSRAGTDKKALRQRYLTEAMGNLPSLATPILISHHPDFIEEAFAAGIPFTLSGHTHGGQITFLGKSLLPLPYKYMYGVYSRQSCYAYVSAGAGHWFPFRLNCPPEVAVFTLKCE